MAEWFLSANFVQGQYLSEDQKKVTFSIELHWVVSLKYYAIHSFLKVDSSTLENFVCVCVYIYVFFFFYKFVCVDCKVCLSLVSS